MRRATWNQSCFVQYGLEQGLPIDIARKRLFVVFKLRDHTPWKRISSGIGSGAFPARRILVLVLVFLLIPLGIYSAVVHVPSVDVAFRIRVVLGATTIDYHIVMHSRALAMSHFAVCGHRTAGGGERGLIFSLGVLR